MLLVEKDMEKSILIKCDKDVIAECESIIIVPEIAVTEAGYIKLLTIKDAAHAKHEYHAMAQMAYFQFQDGELEVEEMESAITVCCGDDEIELARGMALYRARSGEFHVLINAGKEWKKILEAAYRYCTRWVRLDI